MRFEQEVNETRDFRFPKKKLAEIFFESEKILVDIFLVGRKKVEKIENFVNFGVRLTFFVVDHSFRPGRFG